MRAARVLLAVAVSGLCSLLGSLLGLGLLPCARPRQPSPSPQSPSP